MSSSHSSTRSKAEPRISDYGDCALYLSYSGNGYDAEVNDAVLSLAARLRESGQWDDVVSGYDSLVATFNPLTMNLKQAKEHLETELSQKPKAITSIKSRIIDVPVYYGGEHGLDMNTIKKSSGLSEAEIIELHSAKIYRVAMMGFVPGFTFLSSAPETLHHPRRQSPRLSVPSGSIGIAGWQTGIYGLSSPGGWQIIGRTPLKIFDADRKNTFLWEAGDSLRFVPQSGPYPDQDLSEGAGS